MGRSDKVIKEQIQNKWVQKPMQGRVIDHSENVSMVSNFRNHPGEGNTGRSIRRQRMLLMRHRRRKNLGGVYSLLIILVFCLISINSVTEPSASVQLIHTDQNQCVDEGNRSEASSCKRSRSSITTCGSSKRCKSFDEWKFGGPRCVCEHCGAVLWYEERNRKWTSPKNPQFSICFQKGKVELPRYKPCPPYLRELLDYNGGGDCKNFRENIRVYNSVFAFTSMGGQVDHSVNNGRGPYVFRINGQNHHKIDSLLPAIGEPKFAQLYIYDTENEVRNRMNVVGKCSKNKLDEKIVGNLISMFDECNELAKVFRMARERFKETIVRPVSIKLLERRDRDARQYNLPTSSKIAALVVGDSSTSAGYRDIVVEERSGMLRRINERHPSYMAMQYPILFPYAEDGYRGDIRYRLNENVSSTKRKLVTMQEYYAYIIQYRHGGGQTLLFGGRLFQQLLVDCFTAIEEQRLGWIRNNQKNIISELYKGLQDAITAGDTCAMSIGKRMVLPSSFTGDPRYMVQNYQDAMAICRWAGPPNSFITFTCNSNWSEISDCLKCIGGQKVEDWPDIVSRVFHIKLQELMTDITKKEFFGHVKAVLYTIEFQKRGLPHVHILVFVAPKDRLKTSADVDTLVSAELPNPLLDPIGFEAVTKFMVHGPCGLLNPTCPCMEAKEM